MFQFDIGRLRTHISTMRKPPAVTNLVLLIMTFVPDPVTSVDISGVTDLRASDSSEEDIPQKRRRRDVPPFKFELNQEERAALLRFHNEARNGTFLVPTSANENLLVRPL